jgi:hypothetical protein
VGDGEADDGDGDG